MINTVILTHVTEYRGLVFAQERLLNDVFHAGFFSPIHLVCFSAHP